MKCESCGADLPYGAYGNIKCEFCNAPNYVHVPGGPQEGSVEEKKDKLTYASFGSRFWAYILDIIILQMIGYFFGSIGIYGFGLSILNLIIAISYFTYYFGTTGQTPGKKLLKIKVVSIDGSPLTLSNGFRRYVGYMVSYFTLGVGFLWIIWDNDKQGFEDKIAKTYVVKA